jgi:hypothetical protein
MQDRVEVLKQVHEDVVVERNRLRDARAGFTSRLGPLPASAGVAIGLAGAVSDEISEGWIWAAGALFIVLVVVSTVFSGLTPYRILRSEKQSRDSQERGGNSQRHGRDSKPAMPFAFYRNETSLPKWLEAKITLEQEICGELPRKQRVFYLKLRGVQTLQDAVDVERSAFYVVQGLFGLIIVVLGLGIVMD